MIIIDSSPALQYALACLLSYLVGAIPFGLWVARTRGVDIRAKGSGNIGATNVFRCVGKSWGLLVYGLDMGKGLWGALLLPALLSTGEPATLLCVLSGCSAVIGHNWPVYLKFKGGKGIATSSGLLLGLAPAAVLVAIAVWLVTFLLTRYVSAASILAAVAVAAFAWLYYADAGLLLPLVLSAISALAILRHRQNIQRLLSGTENRFDFTKKKKGEPTSL